MVAFNFDDEKIAKILLDENYLSEEELKKASTEAKSKKSDLADLLIENKIITESILGQAIAESLKIPFFDLAMHPPIAEAVKKIPVSLAKSNRLILAEEDDKKVIIASDHSQKESPDDLKKIFPKKEIVFAYGLSPRIEEALLIYRESLSARFVDIIKKNEHVAPEIIDSIISDAIFYRASDVHFEPQETEVVIRFRIDGALQEVGRINKIHYENILNRIKVQAKLRIDEHYSAQDGAIRFRKEGLISDVRISIIPTLDGEKIVARLLTEYVKELSFPDLGLSETDQKTVEQVVKKPHGMILATGPTGSGKTTTLYSVIKILNKPDVNITTIEDPVEYKIGGTSQINVNAETNLTFAAGLKSIVRQDPDIILVGEIRDQETAEISVNAALTGHLLLSTFHANDALSAIPRLLEMGVEPFLLASTLELIIAQRLMRRICNSCRYSFTLSAADLKIHLKDPSKYFNDSKEVTFYRGKGCPHCNQTGFKGRIAAFELLPMTTIMRDLILKNPSSTEVLRVAQKEGFRPMFEDGLDKVRTGLTTFEELLRVANPAE